MSMDKKFDALLRARGFSPESLYHSSFHNYAAGVVTRERQRLAAIFARAGLADVAAAILDKSDDDGVFRWVGPSVSLADAKADTEHARTRQADPGVTDTAK